MDYNSFDAVRDNLAALGNNATYHVTNHMPTNVCQSRKKLSADDISSYVILLLSTLKCTTSFKELYLFHVELKCVALLMCNTLYILNENTDPSTWIEIEACYKSAQKYSYNVTSKLNDSQLAKMKKSIPDMSLP